MPILPKLLLETAAAEPAVAAAPLLALQALGALDIPEELCLLLLNPNTQGTEL